MLDIGYAGSRQLVYLSKVSDWDNIPVEKCAIHRRSSVSRPVYGFDLQKRMNDYTAAVYDYNKNIRVLSSAMWQPIWLTTYKDDFGSKIYSSLETGFSISKIAQLNTTWQKYEGNFTFTPLIPTGISGTEVANSSYTGGSTCPYAYTSSTWDTEYLIYLSAINIAYPLLVRNTIPDELDTFSLGPVFLNKFIFQVSEGSSVEISIDFQGTRYLIDNKTYDPLIAQDYDVTYRNANFIDCFCDVNLQSYSDATVRVTGMTLNITQEYEFTFTCVSKNDDVWVDVDDVGARFVELTSRKVSGTITIFAKDSYVDPTAQTYITMYFGGPFYFRMRNIRWQKPTTEIKLDDAYLHTYNFIALADTAAYLMYKPDVSCPACSEFYVESE